MNGNLGQSSLRRKKRSGDPMATYDSLPVPLRQWLSEATLPWSPTSVHRIWQKSQAKGYSPEETLQSLSLAEAQTLARDRHSSYSQFNSQS